MDLTEYRQSDREKKRTADLLSLVPNAGANALDIGARDGHFSILLAELFEEVTALDLNQPSIDHPNVACVKGDVTDLQFAHDSFDFVLCAEVLEHIPTHLLNKACAELSRVTRRKILVGVPYKQELRVGRTTCYTCGGKNPPWGHVNSFDEDRLRRLFPLLEVEKVSLVGETDTSTNFLSAFLMDAAGNPYGTYSQNEPCIHCGAKLKPPPKRNLFRKILTKTAFLSREIERPFKKRHANWIHILFRKQSDVAALD